MKWIIMVLAILLTSCTISCADDVQIMYQDEISHFTVGFTISATLSKLMDVCFYTTYETHVSDRYVISNSYMLKRTKDKDFWYYAIPVGVATIAGVIKELNDGKFDTNDLGYTILGAGVAVTLIAW